MVPLLPACAGACVLVLALAIEKTQAQEWLGSDSCLLDLLSDRGSPLTNSVFLRVSAASVATALSVLVRLGQSSVSRTKIGT